MRTQFWLSCAATLLLFGSIGMTIPLLSKLAEDLGHSQSTIGVLSGAFWLMLVFARFPIGAALERTRKKGWIAAALIVAAVAYGAIARTDSVAVVFAARMLQGIGFAAASIGLMAVAITETDPDGRAAQFSIYSIFCFLGYALGPAVGEYVGNHAGYAVAFAASATMCVAAILPTLLIREQAPSAPHESGSAPRSWRAVFSLNVRHLQLMLVAAPRGMSEAFVPVCSRENVYGAVSGFFFVFACSMLAARVNLSRLRARLAYRWLALAATLLCAIALLLLAMARSQTMLLGAAGFMGVGWGLFFPSLLALSTQEDGAGGVRQVVMFDSVYDLSFFVGQFAFGLLISAAGYRLSFGVSVLICLASTASLLWSAKRRRASGGQGRGVRNLSENG